MLEAVRRVSPDTMGGSTVHAQYGGYLAEKGVPSNSRTATYAALRVNVDNWRWQGVPFNLPSGMAMDDKRTEILIQFQRPPHLLFPQGGSGAINSNTLAICLQPDEGLHPEFQAKTRDATLELRPVGLEFHYEGSLGGQKIPDAYERLLLDALIGDASLFIRSDEIEQAWSIIDAVIQGLALAHAQPPSRYAVGSGGPETADRFLASDGPQWLSRCGCH